ncbi:MAG: hypothetical protein J6P88_00100, partial [Clostridia bacterium]|nr:hypothetical protein [Clostridia bacterium]
LDYDTGTLTLYGENRNGLYSYINQATGLTFGGDALGVYFFAGNTEDGTVTVSDVSIEKGLTVPILDAGAIGYTAYQAAADNSLLRTVNFKQDGFNPAFADNNNKGADVEVSNDGTTVTFTVQNANNKRAMWGDYLVDALPLYGGANAQNGVQYTFMYDVILGNENVGFGLQVDGNNALVVDGAGNVLWYEWNTKKVSASAEESKNWINHTDVAPTAKQTFAVTMDYTATNFTLYVKRSNGTFEKVRSMTYNNCDWAGSRVRPRFYIRTIDTGIAPDATYTAAVSNLRIFKGTDFSDLYVLQNASGAAVRLNTPTGLRFTGLIGKGLLNELKAEYGEANVKVGMLITPTDYLTANSLAFTKEALDACGALPAGKKYVKITASTILESDDGCAYKINCVLANVREANYDRNFSAVTFVEINGSTYLYGDYSEAANSRSITFVAEAALSDVSDVQTGEYQYAVDGKYSPYTSAQRALLVGFRCPNYISVMNYNIEEIEGNDDQSRTPAKAVQTILDLSPDIVGLQEVDEEWNLSDLTSNGYGRVQGDTNRDMWTELYYKTAKFNKLNSGYNGEIPEAPTRKSRTTSSVTLNRIEGYEYSRDGVTWQDSNVFEGLREGTKYTFYQRVKATKYMAASPSSPGYSCYTLSSSDSGSSGSSGSSASSGSSSGSSAGSTEALYELSLTDSTSNILFSTMNKLIEGNKTQSVTIRFPSIEYTFDRGTMKAESG